MKKLLLLLTLLLPRAAQAASGQSVFIKGDSTFTATAVYCTTGTSVQLNSTRQIIGFIPSRYTIRNNDGADTVNIGHDVSVSTFTDNATVLARYGYPLTSASTVTWELGINPDLANQPDVEIWCRAVDAGGAASVLISLVSFGYK